MGRKKIPDRKKYIVQRVSEIIRDYLYDDDESYAYINMYFETKHGEHQHKRLKYGEPSSITPNEFLDEPYGFDDEPDEYTETGIPKFHTRCGNEIFDKETIWLLNDKKWDGETLSQLRARSGKDVHGKEIGG